MKKKIAFAFLMGFITTGLISLTIVLVNTHFQGFKFLIIWLKSWGIAYAVVIPCIVFISPKIEKLIDKIFKE